MEAAGELLTDAGCGANYENCGDGGGHHEEAYLPADGEIAGLNMIFSIIAMVQYLKPSGRISLQVTDSQRISHLSGKNKTSLLSPPLRSSQVRHTLIRVNTRLARDLCEDRPKHGHRLAFSASHSDRGEGPALCVASERNCHGWPAQRGSSAGLAVGTWRYRNGHQVVSGVAT